MPIMLDHGNQKFELDDEWDGNIDDVHKVEFDAFCSTYWRKPSAIKRTPYYDGLDKISVIELIEDPRKSYLTRAFPGLSDFSGKFVERKEYITIYDRLVNFNVKYPSRGVMLTGQPGVGEIISIRALLRAVDRSYMLQERRCQYPTWLCCS